MPSCPMPRPLTSLEAADVAACRQLLASGSRSFHVASFLLPARERRAATVFYAFCRRADDLVDLGGDPAAACEALRARLAHLYGGRPDREDRALAAVVADFGIPRVVLEALVEGFAWDAAGRHYRSFAELEAYAVRVAGTVGLVMSLILGVADRSALARACDLGVAMQLSNVARDVGEDARRGRLYLPLDWLAEAGIDAGAFLAAPTHTPALGSVVARLLTLAERRYARAASGIGELPLRCRPAIHAARLLYAGIGREVRRRGCDAVGGRAHVGALAKSGLVLRALAASARPAHADPTPAGGVAALLVAAAATSDGPARRRRLADRVVGALELLASLEARRGAALGTLPGRG
ncbi:MAG: phytoene/squalene synthase family protein [Proteobacteria bacterium]|nr:phytoene/squalene synthase family protein [Pseudomonadota bacterium]